MSYHPDLYDRMIERLKLGVRSSYKFNDNFKVDQTLTGGLASKVVDENSSDEKPEGSEQTNEVQDENKPDNQPIVSNEQPNETTKDVTNESGNETINEIPNDTANETNEVPKQIVEPNVNKNIEVKTLETIDMPETILEPMEGGLKSSDSSSSESSSEDDVDENEYQHWVSQLKNQESATVLLKKLEKV